MEGEQSDEGNEPVPTPLQRISFNNIDFSYEPGGSAVLKNLSFEFPMGLKIGIVGTSGSGKSSIAQLLIRNFEPKAGSILVNGSPLQRVRRVDWTQRIGIVFQEPYFFPDTIRNNLLMGLDEQNNTNTMRAACKAAQIDEYIMGLPDGYDTAIGDSRGDTVGRSTSAALHSQSLNSEQRNPDSR